MKKILALFIALMLCFLNGALADGSRVVDDADLFTPQEEQELANTIADFQTQTGMDFVIYTSAQPHENSMMEISDDFYDYGGYGLDEEASGALYLIDMYERTPYLSTTGRMLDYMTDERIEAAHNASYNFLVSGEYAEAALQMIYAVYGYWDAGILEGQYRYDLITGQRLTARHKVLTGSELMVCALIGLVVALLFVKNVQAQYTLKGHTYKYRYRDNSHLTLTDQQDEFLHSTTTRRRRPENTGSSSSGGSFSRSHSRSSSVHTSSSGRSHGGGAGKRF